MSTRKLEHGMRVKVLIEQLQEVDGDRYVIIQKDGEGNGYSPLSDIDPGAMYEPEPPATQ